MRPNSHRIVCWLILLCHKHPCGSQSPSQSSTAFFASIDKRSLSVNRPTGTAHPITLMSSRSSSKMSSSKNPATLPKSASYRRTSGKTSNASTLYLDWTDTADTADDTIDDTTVAEQSKDSITSSASVRSLSSFRSASSYLSRNLLRDMEHTASATSGSSSRSLGAVMRRNNPSNHSASSGASTSKRRLNKSSSGMRLSDLASEISSQCSNSQFEDVSDDDDNDDEDDDESITFEDMEKIGSIPADEDNDAASSRSNIFNKLVDRVKTAASASASNLGVIAELSDGLAEEVERPSQHRSSYFNKSRVSIKILSASDHLFSSSHHPCQGLDDVHEEDEDHVWRYM